MAYSQILSSNIRLLAMENGISIRQLAEIVDVPQTTLNTALSSKKGVPLDIAIKIADYFCVTVEQLCGKQPIEISIASNDRINQHIKKYQSLNETGKDDVDKYTDYILNNEANRRKQIQEVGKKGERECEVTSLQDESGNEDIVRVAVYDSDGKIVGYDLVTREVYEKLEQLGFTVGQERALRIAQPTNTEVGLAIEDYLKDQEDEQ